MRAKFIFISSLLVFAAVILAACGGTSAAPASSPNTSQHSDAVTSNSAGGTNSSAPASNMSMSNATSGLAPQTIEGGSVAVQVTPWAFQLGAPLEFDIAMNTHSVDLADDMLKAVILRDDQGTEYASTAWDGPTAGGITAKAKSNSRR